MNEDISARAMALAAVTVLSRLFYVLNEKNLLTAPEIEQVIKDAERAIAHHDTTAANGARGSLMAMRDWSNRPPE